MVCILIMDGIAVKDRDECDYYRKWMVMLIGSIRELFIFTHTIIY